MKIVPGKYLVFVKLNFPVTKMDKDVFGYWMYVITEAWRIGRYFAVVLLWTRDPHRLLLELNTAGQYWQVGWAVGWTSEAQGLCEMVHLPLPVTCHVTCHVSHVMRHVSHVTCHIFFFFNLVGGGSVINKATPSNFYLFHFWALGLSRNMFILSTSQHSYSM